MKKQDMHYIPVSVVPMKGGAPITEIAEGGTFDARVTLNKDAGDGGVGLTVSYHAAEECDGVPGSAPPISATPGYNPNNVTVQNGSNYYDVPVKAGPVTQNTDLLIIVHVTEDNGHNERKAGVVTVKD